MASQVGRLFRSKLPSERRRSDESCDLDSSGSSLSVDEESPVETQSEALPVSLKCSKNVVDSKRESNDNAKGKSQVPAKTDLRFKLTSNVICSYQIDSSSSFC